MLFTFDLNTTYYIAIAVHKLDNNNVHYNYAQNKQTKTNKQKQTNKQTNKQTKNNYVASVRLAIGQLNIYSN